MKRDGKNVAALTTTLVCFALIFCMAVPLTGAQASDTTPPVTNASVTGTTGNNGWYKAGSPVTVSLSAADNAGGSGVAHTYYRLDSGQLMTYASSFTVPDGDHTLLFYSVDNANNNEPTISGHNIINIKVDTAAPTMNITIKGTMNAGYYNGTATVNLTASDNRSGIESISYSFDNAQWMNYTGNFSLPGGVYTLYYGSYDRAGNAYNNSTSVKVFNPVIGFNPECNKWYTDGNNITVLFTLPASNDVNYVSYSYDRKTWYQSNNPSYYPVYLTTEGNITIYYQAVNTTYNLVSNINKVWYGIDKSAPTIGISFDGAFSKKNGWFSGDVTVHLNVNDASPVTTEYSWDGSNWNSYTGPFNVAKGSSRTIYFRTADVAGRTASGSQFIYFAPATMDQGAMSDSVYINGVTYSGNPTATASPTMVPTLQPTSIPIPTPNIQPSPTAVPDISTGSGNPLAIAILIGVLAFLGIAAAAVYLFMFKPK